MISSFGCLQKENKITVLFYFTKKTNNQKLNYKL